jgi:hypothetical protein
LLIDQPFRPRASPGGIASKRAAKAHGNPVLASIFYKGGPPASEAIVRRSDRAVTSRDTLWLDIERTFATL